MFFSRFFPLGTCVAPLAAEVIMGFGINTSIMGAQARETEMEILANNIANMQTPGYKEMTVSFVSEVNKALGNDQLADAKAQVRQGKTRLNLSQGSVYRTDNPLDVAIQGKGFYEINTSSGTRYTRNGSFTLNNEGKLVTQAGDEVMGDSGFIQIPPGKSVQITKSGDVLADNVSLGRLRVVDFADTDKVILEGAGLYTFQGVSPNAVQNPSVAQGYLEGSNVNMVTSMTRIIQASRAYESQQKSMSKQMEASKMLNQVAKLS